MQIPLSIHRRLLFLSFTYLCLFLYLNIFWRLVPSLYLFSSSFSPHPKSILINSSFIGTSPEGSTIVVRDTATRYLPDRFQVGLTVQPPVPALLRTVLRHRSPSLHPDEDRPMNINWAWEINCSRRGHVVEISCDAQTRRTNQSPLIHSWNSFRMPTLIALIGRWSKDSRFNLV